MEVGTAYVRIRPQMSSFKAETQSGVRSAFGTVGKILLPTLAFAGITEGVRKSVQAAEVKQVISGQLENAFRTAGLSYRQYQSVVEETLKQQEKLGFTFDDSAQSLGRAVRATRSVATATKLQSTAANLARGQNIGLLQATQILIRAYNGQTTGLKRLGVETSKHAKGVQVLDAVNRRFAGASAKYAETAAGSQAHLSAAVEETEALIGGALTPTVTKLNTRLADWLENSDNQRKIQEKVNAVVSVSGNLIHKITSAYETLAPPIKAVVDLLGGFGNVAQKALVIGLAVKARDVLTSFKAVAAESETMADSIKVGSGKAETALAGTGEAGQKAVSLWDRALVGVGSRLSGVSAAAANTSTKVVASEEKQTAAISAKNTAISEQGTIADRAATQAAAAAERETKAYTVAADAVARKNELLASQGALAAGAAKAPGVAPGAPVQTTPANLAPKRLSAAASGSAIAASATAELAFVSIFEQSLQDLAQSAATATTSSVAEIAAELGTKATETLKQSQELAEANKLSGKTATQAAAAYKLQGDAAATGATKATTALKTQAAAAGTAALAAGSIAKPLMVSEEAIALSMAEAAKQATALKPPLVDAEAATRGVAAAAGTIVAPFAAAGRAITGLAAKLAAERDALFAAEAQGSLKTLDHRTPHRRKIYYDPAEEEALKRQTAAAQGLAAASGTALARPLLAAEKQVKKIGALTAAEIARSKELGHFAASSAGAIGTQNSERLFASISERNAAVAASYQKFSRRQIREMVLAENPAQAAKFAAAQGLPSLRPGHVTGPRADTLFRQNELERKKREQLMLPRASAVNAGFNEGFWREYDAQQVRASAAQEDLFRNQKTRATRLLALEGELSGGRGGIPFTAKNAKVEPSNLTSSLRAGLVTQKQWVQGWVDAVRRGTISATGFSNSMKSVMERGAITQAELVAVTTAVEREAAAMSKASTANKVAAAQAEIFQRAEAGVIVSLAEVQGYVAEGSVGLNKLALAQRAVNAQTRSLAAATKVLAEAGAAIPIEALTTASAQAAVSQKNIATALGQTTKAAAPAAKGVEKVAAAWGAAAAASRGAAVALPLMTTAENANTVAVERNAAANSMRLGGLTAPWLARRVAVEADSAAVDQNSLALKGNATAADLDTAATDLNAAAQTRRTSALDKLRLATARSLFKRGGLPTSGAGAPPVPAGPTLGALTRGGVSGLLRSGLGVAIKSFNVGLTAYIANSLIQSFTGVDVIGGITRGIAHALNRTSPAAQFQKAQDQFVATGGTGLKQLEIDAQLAKRAVNDNEKAVNGLKRGTTSYLEAEQRLLTSQDDYRSKLAASRAATVKHREAVETLAEALSKAKGITTLGANELATSALKAADAARIDRTELAHLSKDSGAYAEVQRRLARDTGIYKNLLGGLSGEERGQVTRLAALSGAARDAADKYEQWRSGTEQLIQGMKNVDPVLAHNIALLVRFADKTGEIPDKKQFSLVVNDRQALGSLHELMRLLEREIPADARVAANAISKAFGGIQFKNLATGAPNAGFGSLATNVRKFLPPRSKFNQAELDLSAAQATGDDKKIRAASANELKIVEGTIAYLNGQTFKSVKARQKRDDAVKNFQAKEGQLRSTITGIDEAAAQKAKTAREDAARKAKAARDKAARLAKAARAKALRDYLSNIADEEGSLHRTAAATRKAVLRAVNLGRITEASLTTIPGPTPGLLRGGNLNLLNRRIAHLGKGVTASVHSTSFALADLVEGADKKVRARFAKLARTSPHAEVLLPTVIHGRLVSNAKAIEQFRKTGQNLGVFKTIADANRYAERLHEEQAKLGVQLAKPGIKNPDALIARLNQEDQAEIRFYTALAKTGKTAAIRRHAKDELQKARNQAEADNKAITDAITKRADNLLNLNLTLAELAAKQGRGSEAKVEALQQQVDDRQRKILRDQIATFTRRAHNASLGSTAQAAAAAKANQAEDTLLGLNKTAAGRRESVFDLAVQSAETEVDAAGKNQTKLAKANTDLKKALRSLISFDKKESHDMSLAADERTRYKQQFYENRRKLIDAGKKSDAGASGFTLAQLGQYGASQFAVYGSNIATANQPLSAQDERAMFGRALNRLAKKKSAPIVIQHFHNPQDPYAATRAAQLAAEHQYIGGV